VVHWDINFIISMHDWEVDFVSFFNVLHSIRMVQKVTISYDGFLRKDSLLRSKLTMKFFPTLTPFFGRVFGGLRIL
jgi:hypothetical protein